MTKLRADPPGDGPPTMKPGDYCWYHIGEHRGAGVVERVTSRAVFVFVGTRSNNERIIQRFQASQVEARHE